MHHPIERAIGLPAMLGLIIALAGCGGAVPYSGTWQPDDSPSDEEIHAEQRRNSGLSRAHDRFSINRQRWSQLTKEGRTHMRVGELAQAEDNFVEAMEISLEFRRSDVRRQVSLSNLEKVARAYLRDNQTAAFARVATIIEEQTRTRQGYPDEGQSELLFQLGLARLALNEPELAESSLKHALKLRIQREGPDDISMAEIHEALARAQRLRGKYEDAADSAQKVIDLIAAEGVASDPRMVPALQQLGQIREEDERYVEASVIYRRALSIEEINSPGSLQEAILLNALAHTTMKSGQSDEALISVDRALSILEQSNTTGLYLATFLDTKASVLASLGRSKSADSTYRAALKEAQGIDPRLEVALLGNYASFLREQQRDAEAARIQRQIDALAGGAVPRPPAPPAPAETTPDPEPEQTTTEPTAGQQAAVAEDVAEEISETPPGPAENEASVPDESIEEIVEVESEPAGWDQ